MFAKPDRSSRGHRPQLWHARVGAVAALVPIFVAACATATPNIHQPSSVGVSSAGSAPLGSSVSAQRRSPVVTAASIVDSLARKGFEVPNQLDTTAQECPDAGCEQSIVTDTLRVKSFSTARRATFYAMAHALRHVSTVAVSFAPPLTPSARERYWAAIVDTMG